MKKIIISSIIFILFAGVVGSVFAQSAEDQGKAIWDKLQSKQLTCQSLTDNDHEFLGEYFMGQMAGQNHEAMDQMVTSMHGEDGLRQMHIAMGKRFSDCDLNAQLPFNMPVMGMMRGNWSNPQNFGFNNMMYNNMMNPYGWGGGFGIGFGWLGWIFMVLWWVIIIAVVVWVIRAIFGRGRRHWNCYHDGDGKGPLEILKERYARGEIDKSEYEEKKKDLEK